MEYLIIIALQALGVGFHVMQKVVGIGNRNEAYTIKQIFGVFFKEDWDTLIVSALVALTNLLVQFIINNYAMDIPYQNPNFHLYMFGAALVLGYAGQNLIYRFMGSAEKFLTKKIDTLEK